MRPRSSAKLSCASAAEATSAGPACYGCGAAVQVERPDRAGYVAPKQLELKRRFRQLDMLLCARCQELNHNRTVPAVAPLTESPEAAKQKDLLCAADFRALIGCEPAYGFQYSA